MAEPLLLTGPFGHGRGDHISLRRTGAVPDDDGLLAVLADYSCYPPAAPKIVSCLRASGRYDCVVQTTWFRPAYRRLMAALRGLGVELHVIELTSMSPVKLR